MNTRRFITEVCRTLLGTEVRFPAQKQPKHFLPPEWTPAFIASPGFLQTDEWKRARYDALALNDGRCELCGRSKHELEPGEYLNVDHIKPRKTHPHLALDIDNLQVLCSTDNKSKGNRDKTDWRKKR